MADISHEPVLTLKEQLFFEDASLSGLGFSPGDLATNKRKENYWANLENRVSLDELGVNLDLSIPKDYLIYAILRSKKDIVAMHPDDLEGSKMKKALLMAAALLLAPMAAMAADYKEGVHYTVINDGPETAKPEITEFFSFYCPHCFNFSKASFILLRAVSLPYPLSSPISFAVLDS